MHGMSKIVHICRGHSSHRDSAVLGQIDAEVLDDLANLIDKKRQFQLLNKSKLKTTNISSHSTHLLLTHPSEAEHANLIGNVLPVPAGSFLSESVP